MIDVSDSLDAEDIPLCPLCDQPIQFGAVPAEAHGCVFMVCTPCALESQEDQE